MMDFRWSRDGRTVLRDAALAAVFAVGTGVPVLAVPDADFSRRAIMWSLLMCSSLALRRIAPLAALAGYTTALRSLTQGRAMASMVFHGYEEARVV